ASHITHESHIRAESATRSSCNLYDVLMVGVDSKFDMESFFHYIYNTRYRSVEKHICKTQELPEYVKMKIPLYSYCPKLEEICSQETLSLPQAPHPATFSHHTSYFPIKTDPAKILRGANSSNLQAAKTLYSAHLQSENIVNYIPSCKRSELQNLQSIDLQVVKNTS
ncbi:MAG: hypothetical protein MHPSP_001072, partial [Paramarteilia canceri]